MLCLSFLLLYSILFVLCSFHPLHVLWGEGARTLILSRWHQGCCIPPYPLVPPIPIGANRHGPRTVKMNVGSFNVDSALWNWSEESRSTLGSFRLFSLILLPGLVFALFAREGTVRPQTWRLLSCGTCRRLGWMAEHWGLRALVCLLLSLRFLPWLSCLLEAISSQCLWPLHGKNKENVTDPLVLYPCYRLGDWHRVHKVVCRSCKKRVKDKANQLWPLNTCPGTKKRTCQAWKVSVYRGEPKGFWAAVRSCACTLSSLCMTGSLQYNFCSYIRKAVGVLLMALKIELRWWVRRKYSWGWNKVTVVCYCLNHYCWHQKAYTQIFMEQHFSESFFEIKAAQDQGNYCKYSTYCR